ncbi:unnamed protein product [Cunninghamella blakesleeana]
MTDIAFDFLKNNAETIAGELLNIAKDLYTAYNEVSDDAEKITSKLPDVEELANSIIGCKGMPGDRLLFELKCKLEDSKKAVMEFKEKEERYQKSKSTIRRAAYKVKRLFVYAHEYKANFEELSRALDELPDELKRIKELSKYLLEPNALAYKNQFVNEECSKFWISIAGTEVGSGEDRWSRFKTKYKLNYLDCDKCKSKKRIQKKCTDKGCTNKGCTNNECIDNAISGKENVDEASASKEMADKKIVVKENVSKDCTCVKWTGEDWNRIKQLACSNKFELTLFGFIDLTNKAGFPIELDEVPTTLDSDHMYEGTSLIEVGKMINDLIKEFSSDEMNKHLVNIIKWYHSFDQKELGHLQLPPKKENETDEEKYARKDEEKWIINKYKAEECYKIIKQMRKDDKHCDKWNKKERMAQDVDKARRVISFFYQKFMVICEFGRLPRNIFKNVDFPGKARIKQFIGDCRPLDYANFTIIINGDITKWEDKQPKVYKFLEDFLDDSKTMDEKKVSVEAKEKDLNIMEAKIKLKLENIAKREKELTEKEERFTELMAKRVITKWKPDDSKKNKEKKPKDEQDNSKRDSRRLSGVVSAAKGFKNKIENTTPKKSNDRKESVSTSVK